MQPSTVALIPKDQIRPDADITALINEDHYVLNVIYAPNYKYTPRNPDQSVIGRHLSELFKPLPNELICSLERLFRGEAHWNTMTLPTITKSGAIDGLFVAAFLPWTDIDGKQVALTRLKLLTE